MQINPLTLITVALFIISFVSFIFVYNREVKNRVTKDDMCEMKKYVDNEVGHVQKHVDDVNQKIEKLSEKIDNKLDFIISKLIK